MNMQDPRDIILHHPFDFHLETYPKEGDVEGDG